MCTFNFNSSVSVAYYCRNYNYNHSIKSSSIQANTTETRHNHQYKKKSTAVSVHSGKRWSYKLRLIQERLQKQKLCPIKTENKNIYTAQAKSELKLRSHRGTLSSNQKQRQTYAHTFVVVGQDHCMPKKNMNV